MTEVVIVGAARTAVGNFSGSLASVPAHELGATVIKAALERAGVNAADVQEVFMGQVLTGGQGKTRHVKLPFLPVAGRVHSHDHQPGLRFRSTRRRHGYANHSDG